MSKKKITKNGFDSDTHLWRTRAIVGEAYGLKEEVEEVRHISKLQESAEELPYAVRNLNLPDLKEECECCTGTSSPIPCAYLSHNTN